MNLANYEQKEKMNDSSAHGRQFAYSGGLSAVMLDLLGDKIDVIKGDGLDQCMDLLEKIMEDEIKLDFMEGMACQGGCAGGPANLNKTQVTKKLVEIFAKKAENKKADQNEKTA
jgi:ferredoxin hydrogenase large subunit